MVERFVRWLGLRQMMPHVGRLKFVARLLWLYEKIGLQRLVRASNFLPKRLKAMEAILPPIAPRYRNYRAPAPALGPDGKHGQVAFFIGCIQEAFLSPVNEATIRVLQRNGYEVHFQPGQTCCGAAHLHMGEVEAVRELARKNIDAFLAQDWQAVITNAGGCGATLKEEYPHLLKDDPNYAGRARQFSAKVKDIGEFLADHLHVPPQGEVKATATYSDSCHLRHAQKVVKQPRDLLKRIPGLQLVELKQPDRCCGSAGVYNIAQSDSADAILDMKMADIAATGADLIVTSNTGCHMQLIAGVRRAGLKAQVKHVVEVLDISYRNG
jgi:glycolate oxidase iron-sulfur subunit